MVFCHGGSGTLTQLPYRKQILQNEEISPHIYLESHLIH